MIWVLVGLAVVGAITAAVFIKSMKSPGAPRPRRTGPRKVETPPPEAEVRDGRRALLSPTGPVGGRADEEAIDFRTEGARKAYEEAVEYHEQNPTDVQGYMEKLLLVTNRYAETSYAKKAHAALPAPVPGEWMWWVMSGFDNSDRQGLSRPFPPEEDSASIDTAATYSGNYGEMRWKEIRCREYDGHVDMEKEFGHDDVVAYGFTYLHSDEDQSALLGAGSDDGVKVWVNGEVVVEVDEYRGWKRDEDKVWIKLKRGANPLLLKLTQGGGPYKYNVTVRGSNSSVRIANRP